jgi:hypothetical protein
VGRGSLDHALGRPSVRLRLGSTSRVRPFGSWRERVSETPYPHPRPTSAGTQRRGWGNLCGVQFEIEMYRDEAGDWVATAVAYNVTVKGRTEKEALARVMEALAAHFKRAPK